MERLLNSLVKGAKTIGVVAVGSAIVGVMAFLNNWHPEGLVGVVWTLIGVTAVTGVLSAALRAIGYDPNKDPAVVGPLVPVSSLADTNLAPRR